MNAIFWLLSTIVSLYIWLVLANVVLGYLINFGVVNARQPLVQQIGEFLYRITEPVLAPIRRRLPDLGGLDISPAVLIIGLVFLRMLIGELFFGIGVRML